MTLHNDKGTFADYTTATATARSIEDVGMVEKDYYVTLYLKRLTTHQPNIIFKGGTCLSKCFKVINRFSEDIDLSLSCEGLKPSEGQKRKWKQMLTKWTIKILRVHYSLILYLMRMLLAYFALSFRRENLIT